MSANAVGSTPPPGTPANKPPVLQGPTEFLQTFTVRKPMGLRIHKNTLMVTHIDTNSPLFGKVYVGDQLWAADGKRINKHEELEKVLKKPGDKIKVDFKHGSYSWCKHKCTTVERMYLDKDTEKITGRAIDLYQIFIKFQTMMDDRTSYLGVSLKYDARERLRVVSVEPGTLGAIHLRPGDIIREVNEKPVLSKTMFMFYVFESATTNGMVRLLVECPSGGDDAYRDTIELAGDVMDIAAKQIERFKAKDRFINPVPCIRPKNAPRAPKLSIAAVERTEVLIAADYDPVKLKPCKTARQ